MRIEERAKGITELYEFIQTNNVAITQFMFENVYKTIRKFENTVIVSGLSY